MRVSNSGSPYNRIENALAEPRPRSMSDEWPSQIEVPTYRDDLGDLELC
jgi:hypothetical protein